MREHERDGNETCFGECVHDGSPSGRSKPFIADVLERMPSDVQRTFRLRLPSPERMHRERNLARRQASRVRDTEDERERVRTTRHRKGLRVKTFMMRPQSLRVCNVGNAN